MPEVVREKKENIVELTPEQALAALEDLEPVTFNYQQDEQEKHVGFRAEDAPELSSHRHRGGVYPSRGPEARRRAGPQPFGEATWGRARPPGYDRSEPLPRPLEAVIRCEGSRPWTRR